MIKQTLYFGNPAYLSLKNKQLCIQLTNKNEVEHQLTRPIEDIGVLILDNNQITITHPTIKALLKNKAMLISCDDKHMPSGMMLSMDGNTELSKRQRDQLTASEPLKKNLWQQIIQQKITNQASVLEITGKENKRLLNLSQNVLSGDNRNKEAQAAAYYWPQLFGQGFLRDRHGDWPNALLNYGYTILRSIVARALVASGLNLTAGLHHRNKYNAYCLADDFMEPFRPFVDLMVHEMVYEYGKEIDFLEKEMTQKLLGIGVVDARFGKLKRPLQVGMSISTASLVSCFSGKLRRLKLPSIDR